MTVSDETAVFAHCAEQSRLGELIGDGCARTIASWYADGPLTQSFATTGAVTDGLWGELTRRSSGANADHQGALSMLRAYLTSHQGRGPVPGWHELWIRP